MPDSGDRKPVTPQSVTVTEISTEIPAGTLIPQKHGGALLHGNPGNRGGSGRPKSVIREALRDSFDKRRPVLEQIADGEPTARYRLGLREILPHIACQTCNGPVVAIEPDRAQYIEFTVQGSAAPKDRIAAVEVMGRYGLGQQKEVSSDDVRHKLEQTLDLIRVHCDADTAERLIAAMRPVWTS